MTEDARTEAAGAEIAADRNRAIIRRTRSIRFSDSEWEEVKHAALGRTKSAGGGVRPRDGFWRSRAPRRAPVRPRFRRSSAPLIERMFRYTWFLATEKRDAMVREGRENELDALVGEARAFQESLRRDAAD